MSTPWAGWDEWEEVYALLFAMDDSSARMSGVQHVNVWRLRGNTLPLSVDATATFVELGLLDHAPTPLSEHAQGLMYAMAITRLVNGIVDPMQQASRALSVKRLAQSVGMPMVLVELRHECTHNRMPSLDRLRAAADEALLWLHGHYWLPQRALRGTSAACEPEALAPGRAVFRRRRRRDEEEGSHRCGHCELTSQVSLFTR